MVVRVVVRVVGVVVWFVSWDDGVGWFVGVRVSWVGWFRVVVGVGWFVGVVVVVLGFGWVVVLGFGFVFIIVRDESWELGWESVWDRGEVWNV